MKRILVLVAFLAPTSLFAGQAGNSDLVAALVKKLASNNFQDRETATRLLKECPEAAHALRHAMPSADRELSNRITDILEYFELQPVRELDGAINGGRVDHFVELLLNWPAGKRDAEAWRAFCDFANKLNGLHEKDGGRKLKLRLQETEQPLVLTARKITSETKARHDIMYLIRAGEVDLVSRPKAPMTQLWFSQSDPLVVVSGTAKLYAGTPTIVFAGGNVEVHSTTLNAIIVSGGDITLNGDYGSCLIIARGKVTCDGQFGNCRVVSGKSITSTRLPEECIITENEPNPLGFIRWSEEPKKKDAAKAK